MEQIRIVRDVSRSNVTIDKQKHVNVRIDSDRGFLPLSLCTKHIDEHEQYVKEKDSCERFRFIFTINPVCSNVLFNRKSEIVYKEGSDDCVAVPYSGSVSVNDSGVSDYVRKCKGGSYPINHDNLIDDTSFSHEKIGNFSYHCGYDILSNHFMRNKGFNIVNRTKDGEGISSFNTIADENRHSDGKVVRDYVNNLRSSGNGYISDSRMDETHLYMYEDLMGITESIVVNTNERDGWFGFINKTRIPVKNYGNYTLNRCLNNRLPNDTVDFYPDRSLFSFIPKENKYRKRFEYNWDYCITYPYKIYRDNSLTEIALSDGSRLNGMKADMVERFDNLSAFEDGKLRADITVSFLTPYNNGIEKGDEVDITFVKRVGDSYEAIGPSDRCKVVSVGYNGTFTNTVFSVDIEGMYGTVQKIRDGYSVGDDIHARVSKVVNGVRSDYYIRLFRKIPNLNHDDVRPVKVNGKDLSEYYANLDALISKGISEGKEFSSSLNRLSFGKNAYGDEMAQIVFDEDVDISGLVDHMGRPLTEVYLTVVKNNRGYNEWYSEGDYGSEDVEYSHCFGKITSGFDLLPTESDYNVHNIHNVKVDGLDANTADFMFENFGLSESPKNLENGGGEITIDGDTFFEDNGVFFGDFVNFIPNQGTENVLEDVKFRFNTVQRESIDSRFRDFWYSEIMTDDYELNDKRAMSSKLTCGFSVRRLRYNTVGIGFDDVIFPFNIQQEGYYYSPHHKITVHEFKDTLSQDYHRYMKIVGVPEKVGEEPVYDICLSKPYGLCSGDTVYYYDGGVRYSGVIINNTRESKVKVRIRFESELDLEGKTYRTLFRENKLKPVYAYEFNDGSGRYTWRDIKKEADYATDDELYDLIFTNGRKYITKDFALYLRRQDPYGVYGLRKNEENLPTKIRDIMIDGEYKDNTKHEFEPEVIKDECALNVNDYLTNVVNVGKGYIDGQITKVDKFLKEIGKR